MSQPSFESISRNVSAVLERIRLACDSSGRSDQVTLEVAGKTRTAQENFWAAQALHEAGVPALIGHNRVQEARDTHEAIRQVPKARVHLIGPLQKNKINHALSCVDLIETIDSAEIVQAIDQRATHSLPVFVQVNTSAEASKSGCAPADALAVVDAVAASEHLFVAGLMTIGLNSIDEAPVRRSFEDLRVLRARVAAHVGVSESALALSMGMSRDLEWAIAEGSTLVRVGTDIFGPRA